MIRGPLMPLLIPPIPPPLIPPPPRIATGISKYCSLNTGRRMGIAEARTPATPADRPHKNKTTAIIAAMRPIIVGIRL